MRNFSFWILKDGKYIPFRYYTKSWNNGDSKSWHYLNREHEKEKLRNRYMVMLNCGKEFIANEGTEFEVTANPNDVYVFSNEFDWKAITTISIASFIFPFIFWLGSLLIGHKTYSLFYFFQVGAGSVIVIWIFIFLGWIGILEDKKEANKWNSNKITEDKLKK